MVITALIISILFILLILVMVLVQIHLAYNYKHTINPLKEGDEIRIYTDKGEHRRKNKQEKID